MTLYTFGTIIWAVLLVCSLLCMKIGEKYVSLKYYDQKVVDVSLGTADSRATKKKKGGTRVQKMPRLRNVS